MDNMGPVLLTHSQWFSGYLQTMIEVLLKALGILLQCRVNVNRGKSRLPVGGYLTDTARTATKQHSGFIVVQIYRGHIVK